MRDPRTVTEPSSVSMRWMVLVVAYILVALFIIGVFDVLLSLTELLMSQNYTEPSAVVSLIDEVLLLLIIVEIHRLILAYIRQDPVIQIVINVGIIAIAREIISFRIAEYGATSEALFGAAALAVCCSYSYSHFSSCIAREVSTRLPCRTGEKSHTVMIFPTDSWAISRRKALEQRRMEVMRPAQRRVQFRPTEPLRNRRTIPTKADNCVNMLRGHVTFPLQRLCVRVHSMRGEQGEHGLHRR